jgi:hypothetical protein
MTNLNSTLTLNESLKEVTNDLNNVAIERDTLWHNFSNLTETSASKDETIIDLKNQLSKWVNVFGHLGEPDAVGNEWNKQREAASDLETALETIIKYNEEYCVDKYGDASRAETMACVKVAREALTSYNVKLFG